MKKLITLFIASMFATVMLPQPPQKMRGKASFVVFALILGLLVLSNSCEKDDGTSIPVLTTIEVTEITGTTAVSGGDITDDGGELVSVRGVCWSTKQKPTISDSKTENGEGAGNFISNITDLELTTPYYVRAYATNSKGTGYGSTMSITTKPGVKDADGNNYEIVTIDAQTWMAENLKTTKYNDGTAIPLVNDNNDWGNLTTPGYCWYNNDAATYEASYGALYNWHTVNTGKLCPTGWHVPTDAEWTTLTTFLGGGSVAGGKLKEAGTAHWITPNTGATNETGFTALPGGYRGNDGAFYYNGTSGGWWSATENIAKFAWYRFIHYNLVGVNVGRCEEELGFSVRCLRD